MSTSSNNVPNSNEKANTPNKRILKVGIDFGGVLSIHDRIYKNDDKTNVDDKVGQHRSTAVNMPGAMEALEELKKAKIEGVDVIEYDLISFAGKTRAAETKVSLEASTNMFDNLYFTKSKQNKKFVCQYLGCDVMIDDTLDILIDIAKSYKDKTNAPFLILFTGDPGFAENLQDDLTIFKDVSSLTSQEIKKGEIVTANSWASIIKFIQSVVSSGSNLNKPDATVPISKYIYSI